MTLALALALAMTLALTLALSRMQNSTILEELVELRHTKVLCLLYSLWLYLLCLLVELRHTKAQLIL